MSDQRETATAEGQGPACRLAMRLPADERFRVVAETALRLYLRPICRGSGEAVEVAGALAAMLDEVAGGAPLEVVFSCRLPSLEISVSSGDRRRSRSFTIAPEE